MSQGRHVEKTVEDSFDFEHPLDALNSAAMNTRSDCEIIPVKISPINASITAKENFERNKALKSLSHPSMVSYRGTFERDGVVYEAFDSYDLLEKDHPLTRLSPSVLTDRLLDLLPALEDLHSAGLVHQNLNSSTIRTSRSGRTVLTGLESAVLSNQIRNDLLGLANYCATSLGVIPGIPVEVFLQAGNKRINKRLCAAIQGTFCEEGYEPIHTIKDFHDLIRGKTKKARILTPPILTPSTEHAPIQTHAINTKIATQRTNNAYASAGVLIIAAITLAMNSTLNDADRFVASSDTLNEVDFESLQAWANLEPIELKDDIFTNTWISRLTTEAELKARSKSTPSHAGETLLITAPLVTPPLFPEIQTTAWVPTQAPEYAPLLISAAAPQIERSYGPHVVNAISTAIISPKTAANSDKTYTNSPPTAEIAPIKARLDLSLFVSQTSAWALAKPSTIVADSTPPLSNTVAIEAAPDPRPHLPETATPPIVSVSLSIDPTPAMITAIAPQNAPKVKLPHLALNTVEAPATKPQAGRILSPAELQSLTQGPAPLTALPVTASLTAPIKQTPQSPSPRKPTPIVEAGIPTAAILPILNVGDAFQDCDTCPNMLVLPSPTEGAALIAIAATEVTVSQFKAFINSADLTTQLGSTLRGRSVLNPGFDQTDDHPATYVSAEDAKAYAAWLSKETGQTYRLPTSEEWEFAAKSSQPASQKFRQCEHVNGADAALSRELPKRTVANCDDGFIATAPVKSFPAGHYGLFDMVGNVAEWTSRTSAGSAIAAKGGSWLSHGNDLSATPRKAERKGARLNDVGFRLVRELN